jgi:hypothetical protein
MSFPFFICTLPHASHITGPESGRANPAFASLISSTEYPSYIRHLTFVAQQCGVEMEIVMNCSWVVTWTAHPS